MFRCLSVIVTATAMSFVSTAIVAEDSGSNAQQVVLALAEIEKQGGTIDIEKSDGKETSSLAAPQENVKDEQVKALRFSDLKNLQAALIESAKLTDVKRIDINFCWTGPGTLAAAELQKIGEIESLEELTLADTSFDSKELKRLAKLPNLVTIRFQETRGGSFTDAHLEGLAQLASVKTVDVSQVKKISPEAVAAFEKQRSDCTVITAKNQPK